MPPGPIGSGADADTLNTPPPTMALERGPEPPNGIQDLAGPPEQGAPPVPDALRRGAEELAQQLGQGIDSLAQLFPEEAQIFGIVRTALDQAMQRVSATAGTSAVSPTNAGPGFPGGGLGSAPTPV